MRSLLFCIVCLLAAPLLRAQLEWSVWPGTPQCLRFTTNGPATINTPVYLNDAVQYVGGGVSYSDAATGRELFTTTSRYVYDANYRVLDNSQAFFSCSENRYAVQVVPFNDGTQRFYIFHAFPETGMLVSRQTGLQTRCSVYGQVNNVTSGLRYSILDMSANGGKGALTTRNQYLQGNLIDRIALVKHANGRDTWLVLHSWDSNTFISRQVSSTGIGPAVLSNAGPVINGDHSRSIGEIDASPDGKTIAATSTGSSLLELYSFDAASGQVSNYRSVAVPGQPGSVCFSPDNTKLYVGSAETITCGYRSRLFQVNLTEPDLQKSLFPVYDGDGTEQINTQMQRAIDGRIYLAGRLVSDAAGTRSSLFRIEYPNQPRNACVVSKDVIATAYLAHFPVLVNDYVQRTQPETPVQQLAMPQQVTACLGTYTLTAPPGFAEYRWSNGARGTSITVAQPGLYTVLAGPAGFTKPAAYGFTEIVSAAKPLDFGKDTTLCPNTTLQLQVPAGYSNIRWQDGDTSRVRAVPFSGGKQTVVAFDENGCRTTDSICVFYKQEPRASFGPDTTLCQGQSLTLKMEPAAVFTTTPVVYSWQDGSRQQTLAVTQAGTYWGKVSFEGCTASDTIEVRYLDGQNFTLGNDTVLCTNDTLVLQAGLPNATYNWSDGSTASRLVVRQAGTYWVRVANGGCTLTDTIRVQYNDPTVLNLGNDTTLCSGTTYIIRTGLNTGSFLWQDGSNGLDYVATGPGTYRLRYQGAGCPVEDSITIRWVDAPPLALGADTLLCAGSTLPLVAPAGYDRYQWQDGSTGNRYEVTKAGTYTLQASLEGCTRKDSITVGAATLPRFSLGADTSMCAGIPLLLQPALSDAQLRWQDGTTTAVYEVQKPGVYTLTATNQCGSVSDTLMVSTGLCTLLMPNAFTPDGDGLNDVFRVKYPQFLQSFTIQVFNRWGQLVYRSNDPGRGWDGRYKGQAQPNGNYLYRIEATDQAGKPIRMKGSVVLIR